jgi:hypothetical protein
VLEILRKDMDLRKFMIMNNMFFYIKIHNCYIFSSAFTKKDNDSDNDFDDKLDDDDSDN